MSYIIQKPTDYQTLEPVVATHYFKLSLHNI